MEWDSLLHWVAWFLFYRRLRLLSQMPTCVAIKFAFWRLYTSLVGTSTVIPSLMMNTSAQLLSSGTHPIHFRPPLLLGRVG